jgi:hypothetical protein
LVKNISGFWSWNSLLKVTTVEEQNTSEEQGQSPNNWNNTKVLNQIDATKLFRKK